MAAPPFSVCAVPTLRPEGSRTNLYTRFCLDFQGKLGIPTLPRAYPELFAVLGGRIPDLRGLFLRGVGGSSAALGDLQEDAGRNVYGTISQNDAGNSPYAQSFGELIDQSSGAFRLILKAKNPIGDGGPTYGNSMTAAGFVLDATNIWGKAHTTDAATGEFRPVNVAVRYLIRARP